MRRLLALLTVGALATVGAACDDNGGEGSVEAYCALAAQLDLDEGLPSDAEWEALRDAAPEEISDEVDNASRAIQDRGEDAFEDPEVAADIETVVAFEARNCEGADGPDADADDVDVDQDIDVDQDVEDDTDGTTVTTDDTTDTTGGTETTDTTNTTDTTDATDTTEGSVGAGSLY